MLTEIIAISKERVIPWSNYSHWLPVPYTYKKMEQLLETATHVHVHTFTLTNSYSSLLMDQ